MLVVPPDFADSAKRAEDEAASIQLLYNVASDQSMVARDRVTRILMKWQSGWVKDRLSQSGIDVKMLSPFKLSDIDIAPERTRETALWSKLLPFIMLVWAMTGAFYPAIDLVAGEKERGTLETLLCSPALRSEIVWGKLGTVTTFSMMTAILNASSMLVTSSFVFKQIGMGGTIKASPIAPMLWLLVALVPLSALFSALALAVAAMARHSERGTVLFDAVDDGDLAARDVADVAGDHFDAGHQLDSRDGNVLDGPCFGRGPVHSRVVAFADGRGCHGRLLVVGCVLGTSSIRRRSRVVRRQRSMGASRLGPPPVARSASRRDSGESFCMWCDDFGCTVLRKVGRHRYADLDRRICQADHAATNRLDIRAAILMATMMTTSLRKSLRIRMPHWTAIPMAVLLGVTLHPLYVMIAQWISFTYPISEQAMTAMEPFTDQIASAPLDDDHFFDGVRSGGLRGIGLSGIYFRRAGARATPFAAAVLISALMFGISHGVLQQSIAATIMGVLLGFIALRTGSVIPGMIIHFTNNALSVSLQRIADGSWQGASLFLKSTETGAAYQPLWIVCSLGIAMTCLLFFATVRENFDESESDRLESDSEILDPSTRLLVG